ncbi:hypothetical protein MACK_001594 [Theileria orientalis]|uniref:CERLI1-like PH domain-containing protein n=1 Tax=Theileria orientalis TaxID=68886 RepID=A0A976MET8_THEOR|nr:hypothetical protein MACK_001594 [Theileria orientalis]
MCIIDPASITLCASLSCAAIGTTYLISNIKKIPHPSECGCIGRFYRMTGAHSHDPLDLIFEFHEAVDYLENGKYFLEVTSGRFKYRTQPVNVRHGEKLNVHVRQCDDFVTIELHQKHIARSSEHGTLRISVLEEILSGRPPKKRKYTLIHKDQASTKLTLSIYKMDSNITAMNITPLTLQVLIQAQQEGNIMEEDMLNSLDEMEDTEKLKYFSKVITGPLKKMNTVKTGYTEYFFKPFEISPGCWDWCFWDSIEKYKAGARQDGNIGFLSISLVIPDTSNRKRFLMRYHTRNGPLQIFFKTVDRDRDIWIDGLKEFIQKATEVFHANPTFKILKKKNKAVAVTKDLDPSPKYEDVRRFRLEDKQDSSNDDGFYENDDDSEGNENKKRGTHTVPSPVSAGLSEVAKFKKNLQIMELNMYRQT